MITDEMKFLKNFKMGGLELPQRVKGDSKIKNKVLLFIIIINN